MEHLPKRSLGLDECEREKLFGLLGSSGNQLSREGEREEIGYCSNQLRKMMNSGVGEFPIYKSLYIGHGTLGRPNGSNHPPPSDPGRFNSHPLDQTQKNRVRNSNVVKF